MAELVLVVLTALAVSFLCSFLEAILLSVTPSHIAVLEQEGSAVGRLIRMRRESLDESIAAILTLNTISHTVGAALAGALALEIFGSRSLAVFSAILTLAILLFSEILPKTIGANYWQALVKPAVYILTIMVFLMKPVLIPLAWFNRLISPRRKERPTVSRAELEVIARIGRKEGALGEHEWRAVEGVMSLGRITIGQVMTPRTEIVATPVGARLSEISRLMLETGHLRLPVFNGSIDVIVGVVLARDLWRSMQDSEESLTKVMRPPLILPESVTVENAIERLRNEHVRLAVVLDEYGGTAGIVTFEDLIEQIVGEIQDEHEIESPAFIETVEGVSIDGATRIGQVNERLNLKIIEDEYDTIGGFVFGSLADLPRIGDEIRIDEGRFRVIEVRGRRVVRVLFLPEIEGAT